MHIEKITRRIKWISSMDRNNEKLIEGLQNKLTEFYKNNSNYYSNINFTSNNWNDKNQLVFQDIIKTARLSLNILEIGCGQSNILKFSPDLCHKYTGIDFSEALINENKIKYPESNFYKIDNPINYPLESKQYDFIFSTFVIEHCCFPKYFLDECYRLLKPGGILIIMCPDFINALGITSQRVGLSDGTGREKLQRGHILDAILTGFDNKVKNPLHIFICKWQSKLAPKFFINIQPRCFEDAFQPDVDAVYITNKYEIIKYYKSKLDLINIELNLKNHIRELSLAYLKFQKHI